MALAIRLEKELEEKLTAMAKKTHRSKSFIIRDALKDYLRDNRQKDIEKRLGRFD